MGGAVMVAAGAMLAVIRIALVLAGNVYVHLWDTPSYLAASRRPLPTLLFDPYRPPTYPLVLSLVGGDERWVIVIQTVVASFSWLVLAFALAAWFPHRRLRWAALLSFYVLSFAAPVLQWDYIVYAESLSLSLFALMTACVFRYARERRSADLYWLALLSIPFALARDSNILACAVVGAFVGWLRPAERGARWARCAALAVLLIVVPLLVGWSLMSTARGESSTMNVIFTRVATEPRLLNHMVSRYGMPRSALACAGVLEWDCRHDVAEFRAWMADRGRSSYIRLLLTHPGFAARSAFRSWYAAVGGVGVERDGDLEFIRREQARQPKVRAMPLIEGLGSSHWLVRSVAKGCARLTFTWLIARLGPSAGRVLSAVPFVVLAVLLIASHTIRTQPSIVVPALFFAAVVIFQLPVVLLDADGIPRHALLASISVNHLTVYLLLLCVSRAATVPGPVRAAAPVHA